MNALHFKGLKFSSRPWGLSAGSPHAGRSLDNHLRGRPEGVNFSSKQLVTAERPFVRTVICWDISGGRMGVGNCGLAVMVVVSVATFSAKHWIWLSNALNVFVNDLLCGGLDASNDTVL